MEFLLFTPYAIGNIYENITNDKGNILVFILSLALIGICFVTKNKQIKNLITIIGLCILGSLIEITIPNTGGITAIIIAIMYAAICNLSFVGSVSGIVGVSIINGVKLLNGDTVIMELWLVTIALAFISKTLEIQIHGSTVERKKTQEENLQLYNKVTHDGLTGLHNHDYLFRKIEEFTKNKTNGVFISVIDIDKFKSVNDTYGHEFGNVVLKRLSKILKEQESEDVIVARYGGEEFSLLFRNIPLRQAEEILNDLRCEFGNQHYRENPNLKVTFSAGLAEYERGFNPNEFFAKADAHLYEAKESGRNRVISDEEI